MNQTTRTSKKHTIATRIRRLGIFGLLCFIPTAVQAADEWQGASFGAGMSYLGAEASIETDSGSFSLSGREDTLLLGLHGGYTFGLMGQGEGNQGWRLGSKFDLGLGDFSQKDSHPDLGELEFEGHFALTALGRVGYSWDRVWLYGTAGLIASDVYVHQAGSDDTSVVVRGVVGFGAEYRLAERVRLWGEIIASESGDIRETYEDQKRDLSIDQGLVRAGLSWHF